MAVKLMLTSRLVRVPRGSKVCWIPSFPCVAAAIASGTESPGDVVPCTGVVAVCRPSSATVAALKRFASTAGLPSNRSTWAAAPCASKSLSLPHALATASRLTLRGSRRLATTATSMAATTPITAASNNDPVSDASALFNRSVVSNKKSRAGNPPPICPSTGTADHNDPTNARTASTSAANQGDPNETPANPTAITQARPIVATPRNARKSGPTAASIPRNAPTATATMVAVVSTRNPARPATTAPAHRNATSRHPRGSSVLAKTLPNFAIVTSVPDWLCPSTLRVSDSDEPKQGVHGLPYCCSRWSSHLCARVHHPATQGNNGNFRPLGKCVFAQSAPASSHNQHPVCCPNQQAISQLTQTGRNREGMVPGRSAI